MSTTLGPYNQKDKQSNLVLEKTGQQTLTATSKYFLPCVVRKSKLKNTEKSISSRASYLSHQKKSNKYFIEIGISKYTALEHYYLDQILFPPYFLEQTSSTDPTQNHARYSFYKTQAYTLKLYPYRVDTERAMHSITQIIIND